MFGKTRRIMFLALLASVLAISTAATALAQQNPTMTIVASLHGTTSLAPGTHALSYLEQFNITAIPDDGYKLSYWILDGTIYVGNENPFILTNDKDHNLQAIFTIGSSQTQGQTLNPTSAPDQYQTTEISPDQTTSTTGEPSQMSFTIPAIGAVLIICIVVSGLIIRKVKRKPA
jgi:hypothetical protein